jgi:hypothetical protein
MNDYNDCRDTAEEGILFVKAFLNEEKIPFVLKYEKEFQFESGDGILVNENKNFDIKTERKNPHSNFYIETWSNKRKGTPGWFYNLVKCDYIYYVFLEEKMLYKIDLTKLRKFDIAQFPEKEQRKNKQLNDTWGRCVPIKVLLDNGIAEKQKG